MTTSKPTTSTPPNCAEAAGSASEAASEIASVIAEQLAKARMWEAHYKTSHAPLTDHAFWGGKAEALSQCLDFIRRRWPNIVDVPTPARATTT